MSQEIQLAALILREGRLWLIRERPDAPWELPGGVLLPEHADVDAGMDAILGSFGVQAPAIEDDFVQTLYRREGEATTVFNLYAPNEWSGEPATAAGVGSGWFGPDELHAVSMDAQVRNAILAALGVAEGEDDSVQILAALGGIMDHAPAAGRADGMDVLRTLSGGGDPELARNRLRKTYPELADDVVAAIDMAWTGPALDRRTRSLQVVAMLSAMGGRQGPLRSHINGALNHGATPEQVIETLKMVSVYAGFPAALEAWPVMEAVFAQRGIARPGRPS